MNINNVSSANTNFSSPSTSEASQTSERDLFMTLLVAQLKNQDPLQPQDGTEFVAQLAQFNSLDQLVGIRQSIEQLNYYMHSLGTADNPTGPTSDLPSETATSV